MNGNTNVIFDLDDFAADHESNCFNQLIDLKTAYPNFKVSLFTILGRWPNLEILEKLAEFEWIELCAHGYEHFQNDEVYDWDVKQWVEILNMYTDVGIFKKVWKSPNWDTNRIGYQVLKDNGWSVAVRKNQINELPEGIKYYSFENNPFGVHGHTWTMTAHRTEGMFRNWSDTTNFEFVSDNLEEKI